MSCGCRLGKREKVANCLSLSLQGTDKKVSLSPSTRDCHPTLGHNYGWLVTAVCELCAAVRQLFFAYCSRHRVVWSRALARAPLAHRLAAERLCSSTTDGTARRSLQCRMADNGVKEFLPSLPPFLPLPSNPHLTSRPLPPTQPSTQTPAYYC